MTYLHDSCESMGSFGRQVFLSKWIDNVPVEHIPVLKTEPQGIRDTMFELAVERGKKEKIGPVYDQGISQDCYRTMLQTSLRKLKNDESEAGSIMLGTVDALIEARARQPLPPDAGPIARLMERSGRHRIAMVIADIDSGFDKSTTASLGAVCLIAGLTTSIAMGVASVLPHSKTQGELGVAAVGASLLFLAKTAYYDAFVKGRKARLEQAAFQSS